MNIASKNLDKTNDLIMTLFDNYFNSLCLYADKILNNIYLAEDIVQDVFVKLYEEKVFSNPTINIRPYLFRMVRNSCLDYFKKKKIICENIDSNLEKIDDLFESSKITEGQIDKLRKEIEKLPEKCRQVFISICIYDMKYKSVAEEMNVSVNTIKSQLSKALRILRETLDYEDFLLLYAFFVKKH